MVGWLPAKEIFFGYVLDRQSETPVWLVDLGATPGEAEALDTVVAALRPYAVVPGDLADRLLTEAEEVPAAPQPGLEVLAGPQPGPVHPAVMPTAAAGTGNE